MSIRKNKVKEINHKGNNKNITNNLVQILQYYLELYIYIYIALTAVGGGDGGASYSDGSDFHIQEKIVTDTGQLSEHHEILH